MLASCSMYMVLASTLPSLSAFSIAADVIAQIVRAWDSWPNGRGFEAPVSCNAVVWRQGFTHP